VSSSSGGINVYIGVKWATAIVVALAAAGALAAPSITGGGGGGGATTANVWIVPSGGGCTARASTPVTLAAATTAQKCDAADGWNAAFQLASCGDTILIDSGSYGDQVTTAGHSGTCATITMAAASGATVTSVDTVINGSSNLTIAGKGWNNQNPSYGTLTAGGPDPAVESPEIRAGTNVGFDGIDFLTSGSANGATNGFIRNSDIGPWLDPACPGSGMPIGNVSTLTNFQFTGNYIHSVKLGGSCSPPNDHMDCVHWYSHTAGTTLIANNVIEDCVNYGFLIESSTNLTVRNNWLGSTAFCGIGFHGDQQAPDSFSNVTVEFNSGIGCISPQVNNSWTGSIFRATRSLTPAAPAARGSRTATTSRRTGRARP
jgi:hypothetical protein